ncbi:hypothetical protein AUP68_14020 [Ilyonectria robusta]
MQLPRPRNESQTIKSCHLRPEQWTVWAYIVHWCSDAACLGVVGESGGLWVVWMTPTWAGIWRFWPATARHLAGGRGSASGREDSTATTTPLRQILCSSLMVENAGHAAVAVLPTWLLPPSQDTSASRISQGHAGCATPETVHDMRTMEGRVMGLLRPIRAMSGRTSTGAMPSRRWWHKPKHFSRTEAVLFSVTGHSSVLLERSQHSFVEPASFPIPKNRQKEPCSGALSHALFHPWKIHWPGQSGPNASPLEQRLSRGNHLVQERPRAGCALVRNVKKLRPCCDISAATSAHRKSPWSAHRVNANRPVRQPLLLARHEIHQSQNDYMKIMHGNFQTYLLYSRARQATTVQTISYRTGGLLSPPRAPLQS